MLDLIDAHLEHITAAGLAAATTVTHRREVLRRADNALPYGLEAATTKELTTWLARPGWSTQTRATYYSHLCGFFRWACDPHDPVLDYDPTLALKRPPGKRGAPRPVTNEQLAIALERADEPFRTWVELAAYAALRCCEIAIICREDITEDNLTVLGKGGTVATVPTHPMIWRSVRDLPPGPIAYTRQGKRPTPGYVSHETSRHLRRKGLVGVSLHRFRHWLGTESLRAGKNLRVTQELLRHSSVSTTAIYTQVTDGERRAVIHALPTPAAA